MDKSGQRSVVRGLWSVVRGLWKGRRIDRPGVNETRMGDGQTALGCKEADWKQEVLADFKRWLEALPEEEPGEGPAPECDLHTLFSTLASLRQEVRLQNREQARATRGLEKAVNASEAAAALFERGAEGLEELEERVRQAAERRCLLPFLDVRDALERGRTAALRLAEPRGLFRRSPAGSAGVVQGYEMALERFDRVLSLVGVARVETVECPFDPRTMQSREVRSVEGVADEIVIEEFLSGFLRGDEVLRPAEVVVNRQTANGFHPRPTADGKPQTTDENSLGFGIRGLWSVVCSLWPFAHHQEHSDE